MDKCPNEILSRFFEEACTDDGLAGRSLALVSTRIRDTSRRYAFQFIALYGSHQLSAFASLSTRLTSGIAASVIYTLQTDGEFEWNVTLTKTRSSG